MIFLRSTLREFTAAGVGVLQVVEPDWMTTRPEVRDGVVELLRDVASPEGGFRLAVLVPS